MSRMEVSLSIIKICVFYYYLHAELIGLPLLHIRKDVVFCVYYHRTKLSEQWQRRSVPAFHLLKEIFLT